MPNTVTWVQLLPMFEKVSKTCATIIQPDPYRNIVFSRGATSGKSRRVRTRSFPGLLDLSWWDYICVSLQGGTCRFLFQAWEHASKESTVALKPRTVGTRSAKQGHKQKSLDANAIFKCLNVKRSLCLNVGHTSMLLTIANASVF